MRFVLELDQASDQDIDGAVKALASMEVDERLVRISIGRSRRSVRPNIIHHHFVRSFRICILTLKTYIKFAFKGHSHGVHRMLAMVFKSTEKQSRPESSAIER